MFLCSMNSKWKVYNASSLRPVQDFDITCVIYQLHCGTILCLCPYIGFVGDIHSS